MYVLKKKKASTLIQAISGFERIKKIKCRDLDVRNAVNLETSNGCEVSVKGSLVFKYVA